MIDLAGFDAAAIAAYAAALLATGAVAGFTAGLLGVGGGIVIVPVLFHILTGLGLDEAVKMHVAVGTSLATIIFTAIISSRSHWKRGAVDVDLLKSWGPAILVGVLVGTLVATWVKGSVLTLVFATVAIVVSLYMAFGRQDWHVASGLPKRPLKEAIAAFIGAVSAMMGIGGGTLSVPILTLFAYPIKRAVGTAAAIGLIIGIPGTVGFVLAGLGEPGRPPFSLGYVSLLGVVLILPTSMALAPLGAWAAHALPTRGLKLAFAIFLGATAVRMYLSVL